MEEGQDGWISTVHEEILGVKILNIISFVLIVSWVYVHSKTYQSVRFNYEQLIVCQLHLHNFVFVIFLEREEGRERKTSIYCSTNLCIHWLILLCALMRDWTRNLGILRQCSNQLSYLTRTSIKLLLKT